MLIKKNNEDAELFLKEFQDYGKNIIEIENYYSQEFRKFENDLKSKKYTVSEGTLLMSKLQDDMFERVRLEREKNKSNQVILQNTLKNFTQEMLVLLYHKCDNKEVKTEIIEQIQKNNFDIQFLNLDLESGAIFANIECMSKEELEKYLSLRETNEKMTILHMELYSLDDAIISYLLKVRNGANLEKEKQEYARKHGIKNELEFQFRKKGIQNQHILDVSTEAQDIVNQVLGVEDNSIVNYAYHSMSGIKTVIPNGKKK